MKKVLNKIVAAALVFGCGVALAQAKPDRKPVQVTVSADGQIAVSEDPMHTTRAEGALVWKLKTAGYAFPAKGIVIQKSNGEHTCKTVNATTVRCVKNRHTAGLTFKYDVNLLESASKKTITLDPTIENDGP